MKSPSHALDGAVPRLQQFGMCQSEITPAHEFGLLLFGQLIRIIAK